MANRLMGILNKDSCRGDGITVNIDTSYHVFKEKVANPLGLDVYVAAEQCVDLVNALLCTG